MRTVLVLLQKDIGLFFRDKTAVLLTFLVPFFIIFIVGNIFSGAGDGGGLNANIKLAVLNDSGLEAGDALVQSLAEEEGLDVVLGEQREDGSLAPFTPQTIRQGIVDHQYNFALIIPENFIKEEGVGLRLRYLSNPENEIEAQIVNGLIQKSVFTAMPQLLAGQIDKLQEETMGNEDYVRFLDGLAALVSLSYEELEYEEIRGNMSLSGLLENMDEMLPSYEGEDPSSEGFLETLVEIDEDQVFGADVKNPYLTRMVGGYAIMFLLFATTGSAASLFEERNQGLFFRLLSMPVKRTHILWSKYLFNVLLGIVQTLVLFIASSFLFDVDVFDNFISLFVVCVFSAAACTAFGMFLASVSKTQQQAQGFGTLIIISMSAMGGAWFPLSMMPGIMQIVGKFTIVYWGVEGYLAALWEKASVLEMAPILAVLFAIIAGLNLISAWRFRTGDLFR